MSKDLCSGVGAAFWRGAFDFGEDYMKGAEVHNITKKLPKPMHSQCCSTICEFLRHEVTLDSHLAAPWRRPRGDVCECEFDSS